MISPTERFNRRVYPTYVVISFLSCYSFRKSCVFALLRPLWLTQDVRTTSKSKSPCLSLAIDCVKSDTIYFSTLLRRQVKRFTVWLSNKNLTSFNRLDITWLQVSGNFCITQWMIVVFCDKGKTRNKKGGNKLIRQNSLLSDMCKLILKTWEKSIISHPNKSVLSPCCCRVSRLILYPCILC